MVFVAVVLGMCCASALPWTDSGRASGGTPVLLITVDTLRADHVGCYGAHGVRTRAMDGLAAQGARFENALAQVPITLPSHAVILTGTYPMYNRVRDFTSSALPPSVGLLAEAFQRHGYDTAAFVSAFVLDSTWGFGRGFRTFDDQFDPHQFETHNPGTIRRRGEETTDRLLAWFKARDSTGATSPPFFVWLHLYDPHSPYDPPEPFRRQYGGRLYDGAVAYTDSQIERVLNYLRQRGLYDRTLIVLLSDHGESLGEHGEDEHGFFVYNATLRVPLVFKLPDGRASPSVIHQPVGTIDVAPTLLDLLHMQDPLSRQFQGISLASQVLGKAPPGEPAVYSETYYPRDSFGWSVLRCISTDRFKYIQAPRPEFYDLVNDPRELHNLYSKRASLAAALREQLESVEQRYDSTAAKAEQGPPLSAETVERLKSLGYLAYSAPIQPASAGSLADPKDRLKDFKGILRAEDLSLAGQLEESSRLLESLATQDPDLYLIPFLKAENLARLGRWHQAEESFLACLKLNPTFEQAIMGAARAFMAEGEIQQAKAWLNLAVNRNPHNFLAYYALGLAARRDRNNEEARSWFLKAVEEKPSYAFSEQELGITLVDLKKFGDALDPLRSAQKLGLEDPRLEHYLGTALANVGQFREAVEHYQKALQMKPDFTSARLSLAFAYLNLGEAANARRQFHTLCQQSASLCEQYRDRFE